jgi:hypothetical protein
MTGQDGLSRPQDGTRCQLEVLSEVGSKTPNAETAAREEAQRIHRAEGVGEQLPHEKSAVPRSDCDLECNERGE